MADAREYLSFGTSDSQLPSSVQRDRKRLGRGVLWW